MTIDLRLVVPAGLAWLCSLALVLAPDAAGPTVIVAWCTTVALCASAFWWRWMRVAWRSLGLSAIVVAMTASMVAVDLPARNPPVLLAAAASGEQVELRVRLDSAPKPVRRADGSAVERWRLVGTAVGAVVDGVFVGVETPVVVFVNSEGDAVRASGFGDIVTVQGRLRSAAAGEKAAFLLTASDGPVQAVEAPGWLSWADGLRALFRSAAAQLPGDGGALLPGLAIGDVSAVDGRLDEAMKTSALSHVTAVSGANCALVTGLVYACAALIGLGRKLRVCLALCALAGFVVLVTPDSSVVRAAVMATIVLCSLAGGRPGRGLPALGLATIVLLLVDPWKAVDYGFALSVLATAGLLVLAGPLATAMARWMPSPLATVVAIPLAAQLACQPVLILLDPSLPLYGVAANVLIEPAAPIATVLGLVACILLSFAPPIGMALAWLAWVPAAWIAQVALTVDGLPGSKLPWLGGVVGLLLAALVLLFVGMRVMTPLGRRTRWPALVALSTLVCGTGVYVGSLAGTGLGDRLALPGHWQIAACDVGQGDAVLVRDGDHYALVDTGRRPQPVAECLDRFGVDRVDLLVLTHFDADHVGGLGGVIGRVDRAIVGRPDDAKAGADLERLREGGARVEQATSGLRGRLGELSWAVLWPLASTDPGSVLTGNDGSVTLEFEGRGVRSIFLGDLGERVQDALLQTGRVRSVDVVKVAHHGSADQSPALYRQLRAAIGLISVGESNGYGHPTSRVLDILADCGTAAPRTDQQGILIVSPRSDGSGVELWTERPASDGGGTYAGTGEGGTWRHGALDQRAAASPGERHAQRGRPSRNWAGARFGRLRSSSSPAPSRSLRSERFACSAISSRAKTRAWRSATSRRTTMLPES